MNTSPIDIVILAGGTGRRLGGQDKGLLDINGQTSAEILATRFCSSEDNLIISANRNLERYKQLTDTVVTDPIADMGPLAGIQTAIAYAKYNIQLIIPCDMPFLPADLRTTLLENLTDDAIQVLHDGERLQPLCMALTGTTWKHTIDDYLKENGRSMKGWLERCSYHECHIPNGTADMFRNINCASDMPQAPN